MVRQLLRLDERVRQTEKKREAEEERRRKGGRKEKRERTLVIGKRS